MGVRLARAPPTRNPSCATPHAEAELRGRARWGTARASSLERSVARKFLYVVAVLIVLVLAGAVAFSLFGKEMVRWASTPRVAFHAEPPVAGTAYADKQMWLARPDLPGNPALWTPPGYHATTRPLRVAVFFIHPTSFIDRTRWNAPLDNADANARAALFLRAQASAFNEVGEVYAPRYRQATFGAFLTSNADTEQALGLAYRDVSAAFDAFLAQIGPDRPIILAGHSQGALHLTRLLRDRVAGTPLARRVVAAYVVGWPVSVSADLPRMGLPACARADEAGCILSWQSFAEPADPSLITDVYDATNGFTGAPRKGTAMLCTNPLTGTPDAAAPASANLGTLFPTRDLRTAQIIPARVPARCAPPAILLIGAPPNLPAYVLPGNNYHVYDYSLFWANIRADAARRAAAFERR